jgi:hypothetical protein
LEAALRENGCEAKERPTKVETPSAVRGESISQATQKFKAASNQMRTETLGGSVTLERDKPSHLLIDTL